MFSNVFRKPPPEVIEITEIWNKSFSFVDENVILVENIFERCISKFSARFHFEIEFIILAANLFTGVEFHFLNIIWEPVQEASHYI